MTTSLETSVEKSRISSIDIVRGIVMVIMALDHTRDFFHADANVFDPTNLDKTSPILFFTRWVTHYCAPTFVFLSGVSIYISQQRRTKKELSIFLLTRGLWLVFLEFTVVRLGIFFNLYYDVVMFQVIWAIGISMVMLAALIHLPFRVMLFIGILITLGHNLLHLIVLKPEDDLFLLYSLVHQAGFFAVTPDLFFMIPYPFLPWLGIMTLGYCLGKWYSSGFDTALRKKLLFRTGLIAILLFVLLRFTNIYGDPSPWTMQKNALFSLMSFLNTTKYPASLLYTLMTLGPVLIILSFMEYSNTRLWQPFIVFGRVPLFYYILHFYLIHLSSIVAYAILAGKNLSELDFHFAVNFGGIPNGYGYSLLIVYLVWISIVLFLYPLCKKYNQFKSSRKDWWLSYL
jgi:uncharacterized membrane protein